MRKLLEDGGKQKNQAAQNNKEFSLHNRRNSLFEQIVSVASNKLPSKQEQDAASTATSAAI